MLGGNDFSDFGTRGAGRRTICLARQANENPHDSLLIGRPLQEQRLMPLFGTNHRALLCQVQTLRIGKEMLVSMRRQKEKKMEGESEGENVLKQ